MLKVINDLFVGGQGENKLQALLASHLEDVLCSDVAVAGSIPWLGMLNAGHAVAVNRAAWAFGGWRLQLPLGALLKVLVGAGVWKLFRKLVSCLLRWRKVRHPTV